MSQIVSENTENALYVRLCVRLSIRKIFSKAVVENQLEKVYKILR